MTTVYCLLEECMYNEDAICTKDEITLDAEHYCDGGCDNGWELKGEEK